MGVLANIRDIFEKKKFIAKKGREPGPVPFSGKGGKMLALGQRAATDGGQPRTEAFGQGGGRRSVAKRRCGAADARKMLANPVAREIDLALDIDPERIGIRRIKTIRVKDHLQAIMLDIGIRHVNLDVPGRIASRCRRRIRECATLRLERDTNLPIGLENATADTLTLLDGRDCLGGPAIMIYHVPQLGKPVGVLDSCIVNAIPGSIKHLYRIRVRDQLDRERNLRDTVLVKHISEIARLNEIRKRNFVHTREKCTVHLFYNGWTTSRERVCSLHAHERPDTPSIT